MHGFCTVIACTIGLHVPIGVMACTLITCLWTILPLKQPWVWTRIVSRYFLLRTTGMSCGTRLTAVAVDLSIVVLDDEEMKMPVHFSVLNVLALYICNYDNRECALNPLLSIVSPSLRVQWGCTPLLRAVGTGHTDIARFLLASGSVFNERNNVSARVYVY